MSAWRERVEIAGGRAVLYLGDNRDVWPTLARPDAVVTDPPFGLGDRMKGGTWGATVERADQLRWDREAPTDSVLAIVAQCRTAIVWGGNYFPLPPSRGWLLWNKINSVPTMADAEMAWTNLDRPTKRFDAPVGRCEFGHPTEKPVPLMAWCLEQAKVEAGALVADPFLGAGSTGVACMRRGCRFIGIEIDEGYFRTACRRIAEAARQPDLLIPETAA